MFPWRRVIVSLADRAWFWFLSGDMARIRFGEIAVGRGIFGCFGLGVKGSSVKASMLCSLGILIHYSCGIHVLVFMLCSIHVMVFTNLYIYTYPKEKQNRLTFAAAI